MRRYEEKADMADKPKCTCGEPAKFRGDKPGDHEMGARYYPKCAGYECNAELAKRQMEKAKFDHENGGGVNT